MISLLRAVINQLKALAIRILKNNPRNYYEQLLFDTIYEAHVHYRSE